MVEDVVAVGSDAPVPTASELMTGLEGFGTAAGLEKAWIGVSPAKIVATRPAMPTNPRLDGVIFIVASWIQRVVDCLAVFGNESARIEWKKAFRCKMIKSRERFLNSAVMTMTMPTSFQQPRTVVVVVAIANRGERNLKC
jgi:hypothetical protein